MFSLLVTIISIALVAALALATLYYGGDIFNQGADRAQAAKIAAQGQQVMGALELYHAEHGVYPNTLADLVTTEYLKSIPVAFAPEVEAVQAALAAGVTWTLAAPGQPVIALTPVSLATCQAYNAAQFGVAKVLRAPHEAQLKSCYGASESTLTIIQAKSSSDLVFVSNNAAAPLQIGPVVSTPLPAAASTDTSLDGWFVPGAAAPAVAFLDATGTAPLAALSFANTDVGATSAASTVTVKNTGTAALDFSATSAAIAAPFAISANTCSGSLAPNATCAVSVTFSPAAAQAYAGGAYALQLSASNLAISGFPVSGIGQTPAAPLTAAECLVQAPNHTNLVGLFTTTSAYSALFNQCERPLAVYLEDNQWSPEFVAVYGYEVNVGSEWLPTVWFANGFTGSAPVSSGLPWEVTEPLWAPALGKGALTLEVWLSWYNSESLQRVQYVDSTLNDHSWLPFLVSVQDLNYTSQGDTYRATNTKVVKVKFQDQPDTEYQNKTLSVTGSY